MKVTERWAREEFGRADLGDVRRTRRLVELASSLAARPRGVVTQVMQDAAEREGAFRFIENRQVDFSAIGDASHWATARRCSAADTVIVAVDQSTLTLTDRVGKAGFGRTGPTAMSTHTAGFQVMTAIAMRTDRTIHGLIGQQWWARHEKPPTYHHDRRPRAERESGLWERTITQAQSALARGAPKTRAWYQLDRGADSNAVVELAVDSQLLATVRSAYDRALDNGRRLHRTLQRKRALGGFTLRLGGVGARTRTARLTVRSAKIRLRLSTNKGRVRRLLELSCVHVVEQNASPKHRLEWWLLTTANADSFDEALAVVRAYTARWRVEEFHLAWKSGVCNIEKSQLRSAASFKRWATISAAVAARAERLKTLSRSEPDRPAISELSRNEIDAAILLSETRNHATGDALTLQQVVRLIADIGGYTGKSSGGPPGVRVIQRGLEEVMIASRVLSAIRKGSD